MSKDSWQATLELEYEASGSTTRLRKNAHQGPLRVLKPFYLKNAQSNECHTYIIHPPGGIANQDQLATSVLLKKDAKVLLTGTGAAKYYQSFAGQTTRVSHNLKLENSSLEWLPFENIFFKDAKSTTSATIFLQSSRLMYWDICYVDYGQKTSVDTSLKISIDNSLFLQEKCLYDIFAQSNICLSNNYPISAIFILHPTSRLLLEELREIIKNMNFDPEECSLAASCIDETIIIRGLATKTRCIWQAFTSMWQATRQAVLGLAPIPPRIWNT